MKKYFFIIINYLISQLSTNNNSFIYQTDISQNYLSNKTSNSIINWEDENLLYIKNIKKNINILLNNIPSPFFIINSKLVEKKILNLINNFEHFFSNLSNKSIFYAIKANSNPFIIKKMIDMGIRGIETVSPYEVLIARKIGIKNKKIIFTGNNLSKSEIDWALKKNLIINIGSVPELKYIAKNYKNHYLSIRINPGFGEGEFSQIITGGYTSKFGILHIKLRESIKILNNFNMKLIGIHSHIGSGIYKTNIFQNMVKYLFNISSKIKNLQFIDLGGGFGIRYKIEDKEININNFISIISKYYQKFNLKIKLLIEPGKYLISESTILISKVTNINKKYIPKIISLNTGFNHIIRPALYSAYHHIINISNFLYKKENVKLVGNICESTDIINNKISLSNTQKGNIVAILNSGAYCSSISSLYNLRPYASEIIFDGKSYWLSKKHFNLKELIQSIGFLAKPILLKI